MILIFVIERYNEVPQQKLQPNKFVEIDTSKSIMR